MKSEFSPAKIQRMKDEAQKEIKEAFDELQRDFPEVVDVVVAAGVAALTGPLGGVVGYVIAKKRRDAERKAKLTAALGRAIEKLYKIQEQLIANAEYFREELAEIRAYIDKLKRQNP